MRKEIWIVGDLRGRSLSMRSNDVVDDGNGVVATTGGDGGCGGGIFFLSFESDIGLHISILKNRSRV